MRARAWMDVMWAAGLAVASAGSVVVLFGSYAVLLLPLCVAVSWCAGRLMRSTAFGIGTVVIAAASVAVGTLVVDPAELLGNGLSTLLLMLPAVIVPWWLGRAQRLRLEQAALERRLVDQWARDSERTRIARDMHDSLGHELSLVALHAGAWELAADASPRQRAAAATVRQAAVVATDQLHTIIDLLDEGSHNAAAPDPTTLVERLRSEGVAIELHHKGDAAAGSADTRQAVNRVVQEAVTNAIKHAPGAPITVRVDLEVDPVRVEITNQVGETTTRRTATGGHGLTGLDERVRLLGGTLRTAQTDGEFVVTAEVPRDARDGSYGGEVAPLVLIEARRAARDRRLLVALLPVALAVVLGTTLFTAHAITVVQTALSPAAYARIALGQSRAEIAELLPRSRQPGPPPIVKDLPVPAGASCEYYQARSSVFDLSSDIFRLCFALRDGDPTGERVLVAKDHLKPGSGS